MLRVLTAQSANEAASFAPGDAHRSYGCCHPLSRGLAPEEPPPLPIRPSSALAPVARRARVVPQRRHAFGVSPGQLHDPRVDGERERAVKIRGVSFLDQLLEFAPQGRREFGAGRPFFHGLPDEGAHRVGAVRELASLTVLVEQALFLGRQAHSEETSRGSVGPGVPHGV
jgi:hypothetical protein